VNVCGLVEASALPEGEARRDARSLLEATFLSNPAARERLRGVEAPERFLSTGALPIGRRPAAGPGFALVGDAAGMIDPFTGDGIAMALRGAEILAAAVAASRHAGDFPGGVARRYARAARAEFSRRRTASRLLRVAARFPRLGEAAIAVGSRSEGVLDAWIRWTRG
jgi:flavin-dependent dehydrogenase